VNIHPGTLSTNFYNFGTQNATGYYAPNVPNSSLQWASTSNWNAGLDFGFFRNRLTGSIDVYGQETSDILLNKNLPRVRHKRYGSYNAGKTKGHGIEITLRSINVQSSGGFTGQLTLILQSIARRLLLCKNPS
jgi:hypothetical protein